MQLNVTIPVTLTRTTIYVLILVVATTFVLLPWSVIMYLRFYQYLIPIPEVAIPLKFDYRLHKHGAFSILNFGDVVEEMRSKGGDVDVGKMSYEIALDFTSWCDLKVQSISDFAETDSASLSDLSFKTVGVKISIVRDNTLNHQLKPFELDVSKSALFKSKFAHVWPITNRDETPARFGEKSFPLSPNWNYFNAQNQFSTSGVLLSESAWFPQKCIGNLKDTSHGEEFGWIPPVLRPFMPPVFTRYFSSSINRGVENLGTKHALVLVPCFQVGHSLSQTNIANLRNSKLVLEFNTPSLMVLNEPQTALLTFKVKWSGFRQFVFEHRVLSLLMGVALFWGVSSSTCVIVAVFMWYYLTSQMDQPTVTKKPIINKEPEIKKEPGIKQEGMFDTLDSLLDQR